MVILFQSLYIISCDVGDVALCRINFSSLLNFPDYRILEVTYKYFFADDVDYLLGILGIHLYIT